MQDLRSWLAESERLGQLRTIKGADWNLEIGALTELNAKRRNAPTFLFDEIKDHAPGFRVLTGSLLSPARVGLAFGIGTQYGDRDLVRAFREGFPVWRSRAAEFPPAEVADGPVFRHVQRDGEVDVTIFPAPLYHELDGGRYLGTGDVVITKDPDTGHINLGTYRVMVHEKDVVGLYIDPGKHGRTQIEKYHARGEDAPVAVSLGHHPVLFGVSSLEISHEICEYNYAGAILGEPIRVVTGEVTGLPIPAESEIVIEGYCPRDERRTEGPFGEFTGYYGRTAAPTPVIRVKRIYYRDNPIMLGTPPGRPPFDTTYQRVIIRSAMLEDALARAGVQGVQGVWAHEAGCARFLTVVSIKQMYPGHVRQAGFIASQCHEGAYIGRYVVVVDEDIDPSDTDAVLWALCTRSDPEKDIDLVRRAWGSALDPIIRDRESALNSRAVIDACRPYEWRDEFPKVAELSPDLRARTLEKWGELFG